MPCFQCFSLFSVEDNALLPRLFHLDEYERCLLQPGGLYCLGEFHLAPEGASLIYHNIKKYNTDNPDAFNRSILYRGYCVSNRCPTAEKNATLRFEQCVDKRARRHALSARLRTLQYCTTQQQHAAKAKQPPNAVQQLFLQVVYAILALNIIGTVYDVATSDVRKKNGLIASWSVRASWRRLTASYEGDPRLSQLEPIQGMRVTAVMLTVYAHICVLHYQFYVANPNFLEILFNRIDGVVLSNGTSLIQMYVIISSFLTAYNLMLYSEKNTLSFKILPVLIVKRVIRIAPVHLLLVGFAAAYWPAMASGALSAVMEENAASCQRKFWAHAFFLNNVLDKQDNSCLMPTWFLAVDMHLFLVTSVLTILMCHRRRHALRLYVLMFLGSAVACGFMAYVMGYRSIVYETVPEKIRGLFRNSPSFGGFYTSSWGSTPACLAGLILAHLHYELQQDKYDWSQNQWFKVLHSWLIPLGVAQAAAMGLMFRELRQPWLTAVNVATDRPMQCCLLVLQILGCINFDGGQRRFFRWRGWSVPARLSLPMMLCHWIVGVAITARPIPYRSSVFDVSIDFLATVFYSYVVSVPVALLLEIPVQRFFAQLF